MSLVAYPDSEEEPDLAENVLANQADGECSSSQSLKRKQEDEHEPIRRVAKPVPTLPSAFHSLYAGTVRSSIGDDPSLHSGRRRQVPHVAGNWPSFVYLEWLPAEKDLSVLDALISMVAKQIQDNDSSVRTNDVVKSSLRSDLGVRLPLHVSLSAPLLLTTDNKDQFKQDLVLTIGEERLTPFTVTLSMLKWVSNFDQSRHFLILTLTKPRDNQLDSLLRSCNKVCKRFNLTELYNNGASVGTEVPSRQLETPIQNEAPFDSACSENFHISIAWSLTEPSSKTIDIEMASIVDFDQVTISFSEVRVKIGNHISAIPFLPS